MPRPTQKWRRAAEYYLRFLPNAAEYDLSAAAAEAAFDYESSGKGHPAPANGYYAGKKWMDATHKMWAQDIKDGLLFKHELIAEGFIA